MYKIISFLVLLFNFNIEALELIDHKYPELIVEEYSELKEFLNDKNTQQVLGNCNVCFFYRKPKKDAKLVVGATCFQYTPERGFEKFLLFNSYYINKNLFSAQEFKFIFCHELGHLKDPLLKKGWAVQTSVVLALLILTLVKNPLKNIRHNPTLALKQAGGLAMLYLAEYLIKQQFDRKRELFADCYACNLTRDKEAAISALEKRKAFNNKPTFKYRLFNNLLALFEDHPDEETRISNIKHLEFSIPNQM